MSSWMQMCMEAIYKTIKSELEHFQSTMNTFNQRNKMLTINNIDAAMTNEASYTSHFATQEDITDLERDLHSIKTLHGYTKEEHAVTVNRLTQAEAKLTETQEKLKAAEARLQGVEYDLKLVKRAAEARLRGVEYDLKLLKQAMNSRD